MDLRESILRSSSAVAQAHRALPIARKWSRGGSPGRPEATPRITGRADKTRPEPTGEWWRTPGPPKGEGVVNHSGEARDASPVVYHIPSERSQWQHGFEVAQDRRSCKPQPNTRRRHDRPARETWRGIFYLFLSVPRPQKGVSHPNLYLHHISAIRTKGILINAKNKSASPSHLSCKCEGFANLFFAISDALCVTVSLQGVIQIEIWLGYKAPIVNLFDSTPRSNGIIKIGVDN